MRNHALFLIQSARAQKSLSCEQKELLREAIEITTQAYSACRAANIDLAKQAIDKYTAFRKNGSMTSEGLLKKRL